MKNLFILTLSILSSSAFACSDLLNSNLRVLDSDDEQNLCEYSGNVVLVVNVASRCGYTPQYAALQRVYSKYKDDGLWL
jgi:glutathione peroxidase